MLAARAEVEEEGNQLYGIYLYRCKLLVISQLW